MAAVNGEEARPARVALSVTKLLMKRWLGAMN
jgi:hypothetical protein